MYICIHKLKPKPCAPNTGRGTEIVTRGHEPLSRPASEGASRGRGGAVKGILPVQAHDLSIEVPHPITMNPKICVTLPH